MRRSRRLHAPWSAPTVAHPITLSTWTTTATPCPTGTPSGATESIWSLRLRDTAKPSTNCPPADMGWAGRAAAAGGAWGAGQPRWLEASDAYRRALTADVRRVEGQLRRDSTEAALRQAATLYPDAGYVHARAGRPAEAVTAL